MGDAKFSPKDLLYATSQGYLEIFYVRKKVAIGDRVVASDVAEIVWGSEQKDIEL